MNTLKKIGTAVLLASVAAAANAEQFRLTCPNFNAYCNAGTSPTAPIIAQAVSILSEANAAVGDELLTIGYGQSFGYPAEATRTFTVLSTPVVSSANLSVGSWILDVDDSQLPPPPNIRGEGISFWYVWELSTSIWTRSCMGRLPQTCH